MSTQTRLTVFCVLGMASCNAVGYGLGWLTARACMWWNDRTP